MVKEELTKDRTQERFEELRALRDTIRVDLHLAGMDLRQEWKELEGKLPDSAAATQIRQLTEGALDRLVGQLRSFRSRLGVKSRAEMVTSVMSSPVLTCSPADSLAKVITLMWERDIGWVPVVDGEGKVCGVITDRDAAVAACTRGKRMDEVEVASVMSTSVASCPPDTKVDEALALMRARRVRRLPVVSAEGKPIGVVTLNDLARVVEDRPEVTGHAAAEVVHSYATVTRPRSPDHRAN